MNTSHIILGFGLIVSLWISTRGTYINVENGNNKILPISQHLEVQEFGEDNDTTISKIIHHKKHRRYIAFSRPLPLLGNNSSTDDDNTCPDGDSEDDFPDFLTDDIIKHGGFIIVILVGIYCFTLLAVVCDSYFLPCVEKICEILHISPDVAAATFMSVATSCPELFTNIIGTFVTESDLGIGTIVGSSLFNGLGVAAIGGLAAPYPLQLDWWPLTRDCIIYVIAIICLIIISWDGVIYWQEALVLFIFYFVYFIIMFQSKRIEKFVKQCLGKQVEPYGSDQPKSSVISAYGTYSEEAQKNPDHHKELEKAEEQDREEAQQSLFKRPTGSTFNKILFYYTWPLRVVMSFTIPNPILHPRLVPITFVMCIIWIGCNAYVVSWMMSIIGALTNLPDAILGMTLLAAGGCLPESISMTIISKRGEGAFGVSNSLGANTMNIIFSLGMPWFFKTVIKGPVTFQSGSIEYTIMALILVAVSLYSTLACRKFRLGKLVGCILLIIYLTLVVMAILSEMVFFPNKCE